MTKKRERERKKRRRRRRRNIEEAELIGEMCAKMLATIRLYFHRLGTLKDQ